MSKMMVDRMNGLPGALPPGERIVWQGRPEWRRLLETAFHARLVAFYFGLLVVAGLLRGSWTGAGITAVAALLCLGVLALLARASARSTVYTLTDRRIVMKIGMALPMSFNLPLTQVDAADLKLVGGGCGDIALRLKGNSRIAWAMLWPHVRPWRVRHPEPMLRAVPDAEAVSIQLFKTCAALVQLEQAQAVKASPAKRPVRATRQPVGAIA